MDGERGKGEGDRRHWEGDSRRRGRRQGEGIGDRGGYKTGGGDRRQGEGIGHRGRG